MIVQIQHNLLDMVLHEKKNDVLESHIGFKHSVSNKGFYKKSNEEKKFKNRIKVKAILQTAL